MTHQRKVNRAVGALAAGEAGPASRMGLGASIAAFSCFGCSFLAVPSPPSDPVERTRDAADHCTTSVFYPVMDTLGAGVGAVNMGVAASAGGGKVLWYSSEIDAEAALVLGAVQLALYGAGATYGFIQTSRCGTLRDEVAAAEKRGETPGITGESGWRRRPERQRDAPNAPSEAEVE